MRRTVITVMVLVGVLLASACGGGSEDSTPPADIAAWVTSIGGNPDTGLTEVTPGKVYRTPNGYLLGYCDADQTLTQVVTANICTNAPR